MKSNKLANTAFMFYKSDKLFYKWDTNFERYLGKINQKSTKKIKLFGEICTSL